MVTTEAAQPASDVAPTVEGSGRPPDRLALASTLAIQAVFIAAALYWQRPSGPVLLTDEAGYLGVAADLSGRAAGVDLSGMPYYSPGLSLLIAPVLAVTDADPYRIAIGVNVLALLALPALLFVLARRALRATPWVAASAAAIASTVPGLGINVTRAWAEVLLTTLVAAWALAAHEHLTRPSPVRGALLGAVSMASWITHHRTAALVAVSGCILLVQVARNLPGRPVAATPSARRTATSGSIAGLAVLAVGYLATRAFERGISTRLFERDTELGAGDRVLGNIATTDFVTTLVGHAWTAQVTSLGLAGVAVLSVRRGWRDPAGPWLLSFAVAAAGTLAISAAFIARNSRVDAILYERYFGIVVPTLMVIAIASVASDPMWRARVTRASAAVTAVLLVALVASLGRAAFTGLVIAPTVPTVLAWDLVAGRPGLEGIGDIAVGTITVASVLAATMAVRVAAWRPAAGAAAVLCLSFALLVSVSHLRYQPFYNEYEGAGENAAAEFRRRGVDAFGIVPGGRVESRNSVQYAAGYLPTVPVDPAVCPDVELFIAPDGVEIGFAATRIDSLRAFGGALWQTDCAP